jgi:hypothetical protein
MVCQPGSILFCGASLVAAHPAVGIMAGIAANVAAARPGIRRLWHDWLRSRGEDMLSLGTTLDRRKIMIRFLELSILAFLSLEGKGREVFLRSLVKYLLVSRFLDKQRKHTEFPEFPS